MPGALQVRLDTRPDHVAYLNALNADGKLAFAGPFLGALLGELWHTRALRRATHVGLATWLGLLLGTVLKLALAFAMLGLFVFAWFV